jgi:hypothetical protein
MINPATARAWAVCAEEATAVSEEGEAVPEAGEVVPEAGKAVCATCAAIPWVRKRPMRTATRMPVVTPKITKARRHARNLTLRRLLCSELSRLALSGSCTSSRLVRIVAWEATTVGVLPAANLLRLDQLPSIWSFIRSSPSSMARLYRAERELMIVIHTP